MVASDGDLPHPKIIRCPWARAAHSVIIVNDRAPDSTAATNTNSTSVKG